MHAQTNNEEISFVHPQFCLWLIM